MNASCDPTVSARRRPRARCCAVCSAPASDVSAAALLRTGERATTRLATPLV